MRPFWADPANFPSPCRIHPALTSFADEVCATVARLFAYVGSLALIAILAIHLWDQLPKIATDEAAPRPGWSVADRSHPAFALSSLDSEEKSESYTILRHPDGGRKDIFRWADKDERPMAELQIYRLGREFDPSSAIGADLATRMPLARASQLEPAGLIDSKFGMVALVRPAGGKDDAGACLGFFKGMDLTLQFTGWSCQGDSLPARRAAIACMLDRLVLLTSGNEPKMAELFARAELKRRSCGGAAASAGSTDWMTEAANPRLRGPL